MIKFNNVSFKYSDELVLDDINFSIETGELISIIGSSGAGKSTLVKLIYGTLKPTIGSIDIDSNNISYLPQDGNLLPYLTLRGNYKLHSKIRKSSYDENKVKDLLNSVGLSPNTLDLYPKELSGGMFQRASIVNALLVECNLLIFDEAFSALDPSTRSDMQELIVGLHHKNKNLTIIFITHDIDESIIISDRIMYIESHKLMHFDYPTNIIFNPVTQVEDNLVNKSDCTCNINYDSWRISAIRKCEYMHRDNIDILDDSGSVIFNLKLSSIKQSMKDKPEWETFTDIKKRLESC